MFRKIKQACFFRCAGALDNILFVATLTRSARFSYMFCKIRRGEFLCAVRLAPPKKTRRMRRPSLQPRIALPEVSAPHTT